MNKKTLIQIVIIVIAFGAAGIVLYNGLFSGSGTTAETAVVEPIDETTLLPYGENLNFKETLYKRPFQYGAVDYPKLNPGAEVGVPVSSLITPLPSAPAAK